LLTGDVDGVDTSKPFTNRQPSYLQINTCSITESNETVIFTENKT